MNEILLIDADFNLHYKISKINIQDEALKRYLYHIGIKEDEEIILLKSNYGKKSFLVNISGIDFALDKKICEGIIVNE